MAMRFQNVRNLIIVFFLLGQSAFAQLYTEEALLRKLKPGAPMPDKILSTRSVVLYSPGFTAKEIQQIHDGMIKAGIDAIAYFTTDYIASGFDVARAFSDYFSKREVVNLVLVTRHEKTAIYITPYNEKEDFISLNQPAWFTSHAKLSEALNEVYRSALIENTKKNFLINDFPEKNLSVNLIRGQRNENFTYDLKVDKLAVPKFGDEALDKELEEIMQSYPFKYELTDPEISEADLRKKGFLYILRFVHTRGTAAKDLLGYEIKPGESAFVSVTYPTKSMELKTIPADQPVFKFYARHIDNLNVFLGPKWDADSTWQTALQNYIRGLRFEFRID